MSIFGGIITNGLISYFDINNPKSLINNGSIFQLKSLVKYEDSLTTNIELKDYGLTSYDIGRSQSLTGRTTLLSSDNKLKLFQINSLDSTGGTQSFLYPLTTATTNTQTYIQAQGGYFQNFFKLEDYSWELLPYRYNNGLTLETWVKIDNTTTNGSGIFLYMGTRAENKFSTLYSGDSGYTTSNGLPLGPDHAEDLESGVYDNCISFLVNKDLQIGYKYINHTGQTVQNYSESTLTSGWKHIAISFKPCTIYPDKFNGGVCGDDAQSTRFRTTWDEIVDCLDKREGVLTISVNGRPVFKDTCFPEQFWFKGMNTEREKQIGLGYNITWGGGSFGLKHSYHYPTKVLYQSALTLTTAFTEFSASTSGFTTYTSYTQVDYSGLTYFEIDHSKDNLLIESNFQDGFYGGLSKFRVYQKALSPTEVVHNYNAEAQLYGLRPFKGGRVIYTI